MLSPRLDNRNEGNVDRVIVLKYSHYVKLGSASIQSYDVHFLEYNKTKFNISTKIESHEYVERHANDIKNNQLKQLAEYCLQYILVNFDYSDFVNNFTVLYGDKDRKFSKSSLLDRILSKTLNVVISEMMKTDDGCNFKVKLPNELLQCYYDIIQDPYYIGENCEDYYLKKWFDVDKIKQEHPECFI